MYGSSTELKEYAETAPLLGQTFYAKNKIFTAQKLHEILGNNLTVLRIANIIGDTEISLQHRTFMGWILSSMKKNRRLDVNISPNLVKDFITKAYLHKVLEYFTLTPQSGIFNVSSNLPIPTIDILKRNVGAENIHYLEEIENEQFLLNNAKLYNATGLSISKEDIFAQAEANYQEIRKRYL